MKKVLNVVFTLFLTSYSLSAQTVSVSNHISDQVIQGPCYVFSSAAALESNAMENGASNVNFNEWLFYSSCVTGSLGGTAGVLIPKSIEHVGNHGAYSGSHSSPTLITCPNPNDPLVPCIADFDCDSNTTWCTQDQMYMSTPEAMCPDNEGTVFEFNPQGGTKYTMTPASDGSYWKKISLSGLSTTAKSSQIKNLLNSGKGVIANFSPWRTAGAHSLFIYGTLGSNWKYKDSWPGDAGLRSGSLDLAKLDEIYYISGTVSLPTQPCLKSISGSNTIENDRYFYLTGSGSASNISWSVPSTLTILSGQGTSTLRVRLNTCSNTSGTISVTYNTNCSASKSVSIRGASPTPSNIVVASPNWNMHGETCPNTTLELFAINNTGHGNLQYNWSIAGATLNSGQGTSSVFVTTPSSNSNLSFRVRTRRGLCSYSPWRTLSGYSSSSNNGCSFGGGGFFRISSDNGNTLGFDGFFEANPHVENANVDLYAISGMRLYNKKIQKSNPNITIDNPNLNGIIIVHVYNEQEGISKSIKHFIRR